MELSGLAYLCLTVTHAMMRPEVPTNTPMMPIITPMTIPTIRRVLLLVRLSHSQLRVSPAVETHTQCLHMTFVQCSKLPALLCMAT